MTTIDKPYHHGDLRSALLVSAEAELAERGIEAFSLRQVAKRAGVSHAAPAHHFGDANGLLTALAAEGYRQFLAAQAAREVLADPAPRAQLIAAGMGYVDFALARPALFRLIFVSARPDHGDPELSQAAEAAYGHLADQVQRAGGQPLVDTSAVWAMAHGLADLISTGRIKAFARMTTPQKDTFVADIVARSLPGAGPDGAR